MSAALERAAARKPCRQLNRMPWIAWNNGDERVRVQINEPALAREFATLKNVTRTGYSVLGAFTQIYLTPHTRNWVEQWMRGHNKGAEANASAAPSPQTKP
jgi:hypothetical protein